MDNNLTKIKRKIVINGGSKTIALPIELLEHIKSDVGDEITLTAHRGKYGDYIALYNEQKQKKVE